MSQFPNLVWYSSFFVPDFHQKVKVDQTRSGVMLQEKKEYY